MAITYNGGSGLFDDIGEMIYAINQLRGIATGVNTCDPGDSSDDPVPDLPDRLDALESQLNSSGRHDVLSGIPELFEGFKDGAIGWARLLSDKVTERIMHKETVLNELSGVNSGSGIQNVLAELFRQMEADSESIDKTTVDVDGNTSASFDNGDVDTGSEQITVTGHGFGPNDTFVEVKYVEDVSGSVSGLTDGEVYTVKIVDANTVEFLDQDLTSATGSSHALELRNATPNSGNAGNGFVLMSIELDGVSAPGTSILPNRQYAGKDSELAVAEAMSLTCIADEDSDGRAIGEEIFQWTSDVSPGGGGLSWETESSGTRKDVLVLNSYQIISNKDFESWDSNVPEGWDLDDGTAGTHVIQENASADVFRGDSSLEIEGDGSEATIQISQTLPEGILTPQRLYLLAVQIKGDSSVASGTLTIQFESPSGGYSAASSEKIELSSAQLAARTSYTPEWFYLLAPEEIPDDMELVIKVTGTLTDDALIHIDSLAFGPVEYGNGINVAVIAGSDQFVRNDRFKLSVSNDEEGTFQEFFRRKYRVQLPSDGSGSETINDSIAEGS